MRGRPAFAALRAAALTTLCAGAGLCLSACSAEQSPQTKSPADAKSATEKPAGEHTCGGEKQCGANSCGAKDGAKDAK